MSSNSSQADSAGSIPVTRSTHEKRCSNWVFVHVTPRLGVRLGPFGGSVIDQWAIRGPQTPVSVPAFRLWFSAPSQKMERVGNNF